MLGGLLPYFGLGAEGDYSNVVSSRTERLKDKEQTPFSARGHFQPIRHGGGGEAPGTTLRTYTTHTLVVFVSRCWRRTFRDHNNHGTPNMQREYVKYILHYCGENSLREKRALGGH
jgi:hypothetical protein